MKKYEALTKYIDILFDESKSLKPKPERKPIFPWGKKMKRYNRLKDINPKRRFVIESEAIRAQYVPAVYDFIADAREFALSGGYARYEEILREHGVDNRADKISAHDPRGLHTDAIAALIVFATRAERFKEGYLEPLLVDGTVKNWLLELKKRDDTGF